MRVIGKSYIFINCLKDERISMRLESNICAATVRSEATTGAFNGSKHLDRNKTLQQDDQPTLFNLAI
jgi:hypothetical protein